MGLEHTVQVIQCIQRGARPRPHRIFRREAKDVFPAGGCGREISNARGRASEVEMHARREWILLDRTAQLFKSIGMSAGARERSRGREQRLGPLAMCVDGKPRWRTESATSPTSQ